MLQGFYHLLFSCVWVKKWLKYIIVYQLNICACEVSRFTELGLLIWSIFVFCLWLISSIQCYVSCLLNLYTWFWLHSVVQYLITLVFLTSIENKVSWLLNGWEIMHHLVQRTTKGTSWHCYIRDWTCTSLATAFVFVTKRASWFQL